MSETALFNNIFFRLRSLLGQTYTGDDHHYGDENDYETTTFYSNVNHGRIAELLEVLLLTYRNTRNAEVIQILHDLLQYAGHQNEHDMLERTISSIMTGEPRSVR